MASLAFVWGVYVNGKPISRTAGLCQVRMSAEVIPGGGVTTPKGFRATGLSAGFKPSKGADLAVIIADENAAAAGVFTTNRVCAPPVTVCKEKLSQSGGFARAIVVNSGQANAATGETGRKNALLTAEIAAKELGVDPKFILVASTGVIGRQINMDLMQKSLPTAIRDASPDGGDLAAKAIMTTDLVKKTIAYKVRLRSGEITVGGTCKGSGMIHPNMATMLGFVTSDVGVDSKIWTDLVKVATTKSFNQITVDGDTSTNDCLLALASGASNVQAESQSDIELLGNALNETCKYLAKSIARDGEGATILLEIEVTGTSDDAKAELIAKTVAGSSLVKSAVFGRDPNWGRIAAAAGRAGVDFDESKLDIDLGPFKMMRGGQPLEYDRASASAYMKDAASSEYLSGKDTVHIGVKVGDGSGKGVAWGCDLSYNYVKINAEYTT
eukprot:Plantae.Rhodophyta-Purpureofilum_apyrenoidigerum.ctg5773.p1 GENE.Plantae.Rhodophyta-Purpureofilum_apyrenoidigerum.ctg5773~~Plantae.Rhodophyta-Purpureofilum_apyrenoidigerum.ctg5773.p1  ORF type:complete len:441 (+),score=70.59 Plantae.Rhodophyta-Purpureofilum_apyrenoidigerum.ctg5773:120-1442(+)